MIAVLKMMSVSLRTEQKRRPAEKIALRALVRLFACQRTKAAGEFAGSE